MNFNEYQKKAASFRLPSADFIYAVLNLPAEAGEVAGKVAKNFRDANGELDAHTSNEIVKELGDVLWHIAAIADDLGYELSDIADMNIAKLQKRFDANTIQGSGDNR